MIQLESAGLTNAGKKRESNEDACQILVDLANERGGVDNITVIVIEIKSVETKGDMVF